MILLVFLVLERQLVFDTSVWFEQKNLRIRLIKQSGQSPLRICFRIAFGMISSERNVRAFITAHETPKTKASIQNNPYSYLSVWKALLGR